MLIELHTPRKTIKADIVEGNDVSILFLGGFRSSMTGNKAQFLKSYSEKNNYSFARFDYSGHGEDQINFRHCRLSHWLEEAETVFQKIQKRHNIIVGSSMGGWLATLLTEKYNCDVSGLITLAAAPEFPQRHILKILPPLLRQELEVQGYTTLPDFDGVGSYEIEKEFFDEAQTLKTLGRTVEITCPVRLLHGTNDRDISHSFSEDLYETLASTNKELHLIEGSDHRLSSESDLKIIAQHLDQLTESA